MKVGILTQYYPPEVGAPQARLSALATRLAERGHEVVVLTAMPNYPTGNIYPGFGGLVREREGPDGVRVIHCWLRPSNDSVRWRRLLTYLSFMCVSLIVGLRRLPKLDYLITESPPLTLAPVGWVLSKAKGSRSVLNVSDLWPDSLVALGFLNKGWVYALLKRLEVFSYRRAWLVAGQTKGIVEGIESGSGVKGSYFPNGVDLSRFRGDGPDPGKPAGCRFVYAGLHGLAQGLDTLVDAFHQVPQSLDVELELVGDGPEKAALAQQVRELGDLRISLHDPVPHDAVPAILARADVICVPLKTRIEEAVPSKLYEALASRRAVLLIAEGEASRLLADSGAGVVVPPGDTQAVAAAMVGLASSSAERRASMGDKAREISLRFDRQRINDELIDHFADALADHAERQRVVEVFSTGDRSGRTDARWSSDNPGNRCIVSERNRSADGILRENGLWPTSGQRVLEVGCGEAGELARFADTTDGPDLVGVDLVVERLASARRRHHQATRLVCSDARRLPFPDDSFDIVMAYTLLTSVLDPVARRAIAGEMDRVLRPNGCVLWYDFRVSRHGNRNTRGISRRQIKALFPGYELALRSVTVIPPLARRLGRWTESVYPALGHVPLFRTHLVGTLHRRA